MSAQETGELTRLARSVLGIDVRRRKRGRGTVWSLRVPNKKGDGWTGAPRPWPQDPISTEDLRALCQRKAMLPDARALRARIAARADLCARNAEGHRARGGPDGRLIAELCEAEAGAHRLDLAELDALFPDAKPTETEGKDHDV